MSIFHVLFVNHKYTLTHWGRVTHICVVKLTNIGSDNGLSPGRRQAIIWTNSGILLIRPLGTNFIEILIGIQTFSFKKISSAKWRSFCLGLNVLKQDLSSWFSCGLIPVALIIHSMNVLSNVLKINFTYHLSQKSDIFCFLTCNKRKNHEFLWRNTECIVTSNDCCLSTLNKDVVYNIIRHGVIKIFSSNTAMIFC